MSRRAVDMPFSPARFPVFYGYAIVVLGTVGVLMSVPGQTMGVSPFTEPLMAALGMTRVRLSLAYMVGTILSSLLLVPVGRLYDRVGARVLGAVSCVALGLVLLGLGRCDVLARYLGDIGGPAYVPAVAFGVILVGFFALRFSGQGVLTLVSRNMVMKWFDRKRGRVSGVSGVFEALAFSSSPLLLKLLIEYVGWRDAWAILAGVIGIGGGLMALVFWRDNPEVCGLAPDGDAGGADPDGKAPLAPVRNFRLGEAVRHYTFWVFALGMALFALYITGMTFHVASVFRQVGVAETKAFAVFLPASILGIGSRLSGGWLSDRVPLRYLLAGMLVGIAVGAAGLIVPHAGSRFWLIVAGNGVCGGLFGLLFQITWPRFFGRLHLGAISGMNMSLVVFASALGPVAFGQAFERTGSYAWAGWPTLGVAVVLAVCAFRARDPQPSASSSPPDP